MFAKCFFISGSLRHCEAHCKFRHLLCGHQATISCHPPTLDCTSRLTFHTFKSGSFRSFKRVLRVAVPCAGNRLAFRQWGRLVGFARKDNFRPLAIWNGEAVAHRVPEGLLIFQNAKEISRCAQRLKIVRRNCGVALFKLLVVRIYCTAVPTRKRSAAT